MAAADSGQSWAVLAMSEMGKGVWLKQRLAATKPQALLIWDTNDEYSAFAQAAPTLLDVLKATHGRQAFAVRYVSKAKTDLLMRREFETFCTLAYGAAGATIVVEELADVTSPSYAPPAWRKLNTRGRHHQGLTLYWCSQSPAFIDKASMGNASHLHVGYLGEPRHRQAAAAHMGCTPEDIDALQQFEWIEYVKATKQRTAGRVTLAAKPAATAPGKAPGKAQTKPATKAAAKPARRRAS